MSSEGIPRNVAMDSVGKRNYVQKTLFSNLCDSILKRRPCPDPGRSVIPRDLEMEFGKEFEYEFAGEFIERE
jgi:hypothetical protein